MKKIILIVIGIFILLIAVFFLTTRQEGEQQIAEQETPVEPEAEATVLVGGNETLGPFLVGSNGMTLYTFANDEPFKSNCYGQCAVNWPPLLTEGESIPGEGLRSLGVIEREDGSRQVVTSDGKPLYFWADDQKPGDATGHGVDNAWFVAEPLPEHGTTTPEGENPSVFCDPFLEVQAVYSCEDAIILALREVEADHGGDIKNISRETIQGADMWLVSLKLDHPHFAEAFGEVVSEALVGIRLDGKDGPKVSYKQVLESSNTTHAQ